MKKFLPLLFVILSMTLTGCTSAQDPLLPSNEEAVDEVIENEIKETETLAPNTLSVAANSIYEYQKLTRDNNTNTPYKTSEPLNVVMIKDITLEGTGFWTSELWGPEGWESKDSNTEQNFYIKSIAYQPNDSVGITTWFGPFKGKLGSLVEEANLEQRFWSNSKED